MVGDSTRQQRQLVAPPFHRCAVRGYHEIMVDVVNTEIAEWKTGTGIDIHEKVRALTLRIASAVLFSRDPAEAYPIGRMLEDWVRTLFFDGRVDLSIAGSREPLPWNVTPGRTNREGSSCHDRRAGARNPCARIDVLSLLMEARDNEGRAMTDTELVGQVSILFIASFETTTSALTWSLFLLAQHPAGYAPADG
jgi:cytochrome P450